MKRMLHEHGTSWWYPYQLSVRRDCINDEAWFEYSIYVPSSKLSRDLLVSEWIHWFCIDVSVCVCIMLFELMGVFLQ